MKVLVCGGRDFSNRKKLFSVLNKIHRSKKISLLISGAARGADSLAEEWANENDVEKHIFPANWKKFGRKAGFIRNQQMLDEGNPDLVVAFTGGVGTDRMVQAACRQGYEVLTPGNNVKTLFGNKND